MAGVAKVIFNNRTLVDVTQDTVQSGTLMAGETALGSDGEVVLGTAQEDHEKDLIEGTISGAYINPTATFVGSWLFQGYQSLTYVSLPQAQIVSSSAFQDCTNLSGATFLKASSIYNSAFMGCQKLEELNLPMASKMNDYACYGCSILHSVNVPYVFSPGATTFQNCYSLSCWVHDSKGIYTGCFAGCINLSIVDCGPRLQETRPTMWQDCSKLSTIIMRRDFAIVALSASNALNKTPFWSTGTGGVLYVPQSLVSAYLSATNWSPVLAYENNEVRAIEGSPYESMYADGTPLTEEYLGASSSDYVELTVPYSDDWVVEIDGILNYLNPPTTYIYFFRWGSGSYGGGFKSGSQLTWSLNNGMQSILLTVGANPIKNVLFDYVSKTIQAVSVYDVTYTQSTTAATVSPGNVYGRLCFTQGEQFKRVSFTDQNGVVRYNYICSKDANNVACMYDTINDTYSYSYSGTAKIIKR